MGDLLGEMLRITDKLDALPPLPLAVKLHPADLRTFRRDTAPDPAHLAPFGQMEVFVDTGVARGHFAFAYTREEVDRWRRGVP